MSPTFPIMHVFEKLHCVKPYFHSHINKRCNIRGFLDIYFAASFFFLLQNFLNNCSSFVCTRQRYCSSSSEGLNEFSKSIGSRRYTPSRLRTRLSTTYSQFLVNVDIPPLGQDVIIRTSFDILCSL